jgi:tRNA dimethylallyltransferase
MRTEAKVVAIFGPTGVGKTAVALELAELLGAQGRHVVAVSADALQVYAGLEILTGVATAAEQRRLEHRLVSFVALSDTFSAGRYAELAHAEIDGLLAAGSLPLVVGGTGLYLRAALAKLDLRPPPQRGVRERLVADLAARGAEALHADLIRDAPEVAATIDPGDTQRVVRALELAKQGQTAARTGPSQLWTAEMRHPTLLAGLTMERADLYARIDARVDAMLTSGVREEVAAAALAHPSATARRAVGFSELCEGDVAAMKRRSRNYARRQLTWMRKLPAVHLIDLSRRTPEQAAAEIATAAGLAR